MVAHRGSHTCWKLLKEQVKQKKKNKVKGKKLKIGQTNYIGPEPCENVQFHRYTTDCVILVAKVLTKFKVTLFPTTCQH